MFDNEMIARADAQFRRTGAIARPASSFVAETMTDLGELELSHDEHTQWLVHVKGPITAAAKRKLAAHLAPFKLGLYVPHNTFIVEGPKHADFQHTLKAGPAVLHAVQMLPTHKLSPHLSSVEHADLTVNISPEFSQSHSSAQRIAQQLTTAARAAGLRDVQFSAPSSRKLLTTTGTGADRETLLQLLSKRGEVSWVEPKTAFHLMNKFAAGVIQSDNHPNYTQALWDRGITGEGQVVAVSDTGIDHDSCFFYDPSHDTPIDRTNMSHRKIVRYMDLSDDRDSINGHGTHVAGSVAGAARIDGPLSEYNGMAPAAKLAFYDIMKSNSDILEVPEDLKGVYYVDAYEEATAHIYSNSWGSSDGVYGSECFDTDEFAYENEHVLSLFAAGNDGLSGFYSISSPGISKNILSVGATKNTAASFEELGDDSGMDITSSNGAQGEIYLAPASFGASYRDLAEFNVDIVRSVPRDGCSAITNNVSGKIVLVDRGTCEFVVKAQNAENAGAAMFMLRMTDDEPPLIMGGNGGGINIPSLAVGKSDIDRFGVETFSVSGAGPRIVPNPDNSEHNMASFSARGPTLDGRLKPDIVAPGASIESARSNGAIGSPNTCSDVEEGTFANQGTSMATPIVAGGVALIRQYFMEGFYPSGAASSNDEFMPTGALLKAIVLASGNGVGGRVAFSGVPTTFRDVQPPPSIYQGYGRMQLTAALTFADSVADPQVPEALWIAPDDVVATMQTRHFCFSVDPASASGTDLPALRATLVWTDPVPSLGARALLVNDLDLFVRDETSGEMYLGNTHHFTDEQGTHVQWDRANNVEQVSVPRNGTTPSLFSVQVRGTNVPGPSDVQKYALVVTGAVTEVDVTDCSGTVVCPNDCGGPERGTCNEAGLCECLGNFAGDSCSQESRTVAVSGDLSEEATVASTGWAYYHVEITTELAANLTRDGLGFQIVMQRTQGLGDPDMYVAFDRFPTLIDHDYSSLACEPCGSESEPVAVRKEDVQVGVYRIGVFGFCCDNSEVVISYDTYVPKKSSNKAWLVPVAVILSVVLVSAYCWYSYYYKARDQRALGEHFQAQPEDGYPLQPVAQAPRG